MCNLWRNYDDINDSWDSVLGIITHYAQNQDQFQPFAAPGQWNDPDMVRAFGPVISNSNFEAAVINILQLCLWYSLEC